MKEYKSFIPELKIISEPTDFKKVKITSSRDAYEYMKPFFSGSMEVYESMFILLLNRANNTIGYAKISQGGIAGTVVDCKIIAKYAVNSLASSLILGHNHPSGNIEPSEQDVRVTREIRSALELLDVKVLDHIILGETSYKSLADEGLI